MSARDNLHSAIVIAAVRGRCNEEGIAYMLDAYRDEVIAEHRASFTMKDARAIARHHRDEVLREAAEKIRAKSWGEPCVQGCCPGGTPDDAADLIDPDKDKT